MNGPWPAYGDMRSQWGTAGWNHPLSLRSPAAPAVPSSGPQKRGLAWDYGRQPGRGQCDSTEQAETYLSQRNQIECQHHPFNLAASRRRSGVEHDLSLQSRRM